MGREARMRAAAAALTSGQHRPALDWIACAICRLDFPVAVQRGSRLEYVSICDRCLLADIALLMRTMPATVCMLPSVRALQGKEPVVLRAQVAEVDGGGAHVG